MVPLANPTRLPVLSQKNLITLSPVFCAKIWVPLRKSSVVVPFTVSETDAGASAAAAAYTYAGIHWARSSNARKNDSSFALLCMLFSPSSRFLYFLCAVTTV